MTTAIAQRHTGTSAAVGGHGAAGAVGTTPPPLAVDVPTAGMLSAWAARIDADGIAAHEDLARRVVVAASRSGLCPVLVDVLADPAEPSVARERAFGRLAAALAQH